jgi:FKBP-type peptidyl-prolyl cis-trans isomerase (trigger factor)
VVPADGGEQPPPQGTVEQQIQALLDQAAQHFVAADAALRAEDLATYQSEIAAAQDATTQAQELIAELLGVQPSPSPSPSPSG